jgi:hypothetical protein
MVSPKRGTPIWPRIRIIWSAGGVRSRDYKYLSIFPVFKIRVFQPNYLARVCSLRSFLYLYFALFFGIGFCNIISTNDFIVIILHKNGMIRQKGQNESEEEKRSNRYILEIIHVMIIFRLLVNKCVF